MAKSKHAPVLFELIRGEQSDGGGGLKMPQWLSKGAKPLPAAVVPERPAEPTEGANVTVLDPAPKNPLHPSSPTPRPPWLELNGSFIRLSLTSLSAAVALFGIGVLLLGAYLTGRGIGQRQGFRAGFQSVAAPTEASPPDETDELTRIQNQAPATHLIGNVVQRSTSGLPPAPSGAGREPTAASPSSGGEARWVRGHTYIVVQEFSAGQDQEARRAQEFLAQREVPTTVVTLVSGAVQLVTTQGYNRKDPAQAALCEELLKKVHTLGEQYFAAGGRYRLKGYYRTLKGTTWP